MKTNGFILPVFAAGCLIYAGLSIASSQPKRTLTAPPSPPPTSDFLHSVAAVGLIEPSSEIISMGTNRSGVVEKVLVENNQRVTAGQPLLKLDTRDLEASRTVSQAALHEAEAQVRVAESELTQARSHLRFAEGLQDSRALSTEEKTQRETTVAIAAARLDAAKAAVESARGRLQVVETDLARSTVCAPMDATVLQVKVRAGEYVAAATSATPWLTLGRMDPLHVRADVDEQEAFRIRPENEATGHVRGAPEQRFDLEFVRFEPLVIPKKSLTGDSTERVDTRVLQVIYRLRSHSGMSLFAGQQVDVFIAARDESNVPAP